MMPFHDIVSRILIAALLKEEQENGLIDSSLCWILLSWRRVKSLCSLPLWSMFSGTIGSSCHLLLLRFGKLLTTIFGAESVRSGVCGSSVSAHTKGVKYAERVHVIF